MHHFNLNTQLPDEIDAAWRAKQVVDGDPAFEARIRAALTPAQAKRMRRFSDRSPLAHRSTHRPVHTDDANARAAHRTSRRRRRDRWDRLISTEQLRLSFA